MSGHSKWANIRRTKEKMDAKRGKIFTKIGKEIVVAVKLGGGDPLNNPRLRDCIAKAKAANMPNDNINRSIKKASGELGNVNYEEITYEGYGIAGSAVIVKCLTDNKNRTAGDVRHLFDKFGGSMGNSGCVSYMFENKGVFVIEKKEGLTEDGMFEIALEIDAEDVETTDDAFIIKCDPSKFADVKQGLEDKGIEVLDSSIAMVSNSTIDLDDEKYDRFMKLIDALEDLDDVQDVYHNVN